MLPCTEEKGIQGIPYSHFGYEGCQKETFAMLAAEDTKQSFLRLWACVRMLSVVHIGMSMRTTVKKGR